MGRKSATKIKVDPFKSLEPHVMSRRCDSLTFLTLRTVVSKTLKFIENYNKELSHEKRLKIFHIFLCASVRTIAMHPEMNRYISGRKYWQRNEITMSFVIKKELKYKAKETLVKVRFSPFETLETVRDKLYKIIYSARSDKGNKEQDEIEFFGKMPRFMKYLAVKILNFGEFFGLLPRSFTKTDPMFATVMIANLGSVNIKAGVLHHLYHYGNTSIFSTINRIFKDVVVNQETKEISVEDVMDLGMTMDERISEGFSVAKAMEHFTHFIENPEVLEDIPLIPEDRIKELQLKNLDKDLLYAEYKKKMQENKPNTE